MAGSDYPGRAGLGMAKNEGLSGLLQLFGDDWRIILLKRLDQLGGSK